MLRLIKKVIARFSGGRLFPDYHPRFDGLSRKDQLARQGEGLALRELKRSGYVVLARGWRWHRYELDIIARKGNVIAVVEVKTRSDDSFGEPQEAVPRWKQRRIITAAQAYVKRFGLENNLLRFDIIAVVIPPAGKPRVEHIENAFTP